MFWKNLTVLAVLLIAAGCRIADIPAYSEFTTRYTGERTELYFQGKKWDFADFLKTEFAAHPEMECTDLAKLCSQAAYAADKNLTGQREAFDKDFADADSGKKSQLARVISPDAARVDIAAWKAAGLPGEWLFRMSVMENKFNDSDAEFRKYLLIAEQMLGEVNAGFSAEEFRNFVQKHLTSPDSHTALQHSPAYLKNHGKYRVINTRLLQTIPVLEKAAALPDNKARRIIAIDGRSASGKTTISGQLKTILNAQIIHMDDFFLPPEKRTAMRYDEPGGNVHYERFRQEILPFISQANAFSYRIFDCKLQKFNGNRIIWESDWIIVEGAYSHHPVFGNYADLKIFYDILPEEQLRRIYERNGTKAARMFQNRWIPLENKYIRHFDIMSGADLIIR